MFELIQTLKNAKHLTKDHIDITIASLAKESNFDQQMELKKLLETKNLAVTSENYHNFAVSLLKSQKNVSGSEAKLFLQDMKAKGVKGNEIVYSAIISRFIAAGGEYISDAISLLKELKSEGVVIP